MKNIKKIITANIFIENLSLKDPSDLKDERQKNTVSELNRNDCQYKIHFKTIINGAYCNKTRQSEHWYYQRFQGSKFSNVIIKIFLLIFNDI